MVLKIISPGCGVRASLMLFSLHTFSFFYMLFSLLKHYLELYITDFALKVSRSLCCFTGHIFHGVENYIPRLWSTGISDAIFTAFYLVFLIYKFFWDQVGSNFNGWLLRYSY